MTEPRAAPWERLDAAADTPRSTPGGSETSRSTRSDLRLRRSRSPILTSLDGGGSVFQRRMRDVLIGSTLILVPAVALNLWATVAAFDRFDPDDTVLPSIVTDDTSGGVEDVSVWLAVVFASAVTAVVGHYQAQLLIGERFRTPVSLRGGLGETVRRLPSILGAWALTHFWVPLFALVAVTSDGDTIAGLSTIGLALMWFLSAAALLVMPTMVGERLGAIRSIVRAFRLLRLRFGVCLLFVLAASILSTLLLVGIATLVPLLEATGFLTLGGAAWIVQGVMIQLGVLIVVPLIALGTAQLYVEIRLDAEGLDLVIDADTAFGPRPVPGASPR